MSGNIFKNEKKLNIIMYVCIALFTGVRLCLYLRTPIVIFPNEGYDDRLCYEHAFNLCSMNWLGDYSYLVLCKYAAYGFFMALCYICMVPYSLGLAILNISSAVAFSMAIRKKVNKYANVAIYILMLFNPIYFNSIVSQRIYRNAILPGAVLLLFSAYIGLYFNRKEKLRKQLVWTAVAGVSLPFFWYIKEDSIWVLPFIVVITALIIGEKLVKKERYLKTVVILAIPFICLITVTGAISVMNKCKYDTFVINERKGGEFGKLINNLMLIDSDAKNEEIWVTSDMLSKAYEACPTFGELEGIMSVDSTFQREGGEIPGDHIEWKLLNMINQSGYYEDAPSTQAYIRKMNEEFEEAYKEGRLEKDNLIHISKGIRGMTIPQIFREMGNGCKYLVYVSMYKNCEPKADYTSFGEYNDIRRVETFLATTAVMDGGDFTNKYAAYPLKISTILVKIFEVFTYVSSILAVVFYILFTIRTVKNCIKKKYDKIDAFLVILGLLLSAFVATFEYSVFSSFFTKEMIQGYTSFYLAGIFPLMAAFKYLSIYYGIKYIKEKLNKSIAD